MLVVTNCEASFLNLDAAQDPASGVALRDAQLYTLSQCASPQEWLATAATHPRTLHGDDPAIELRTICREAEGHAAYPACRVAAWPSGA